MSTVEHAKDLYVLSSHAVGEYIGRPCDNKLAGIRYTAGASGRGIIMEDLYGIADALCGVGRCGGVMVGDRLSRL